MLAILERLRNIKTSECEELKARQLKTVRNLYFGTSTPCKKWSARLKERDREKSKLFAINIPIIV